MDHVYMNMNHSWIDEAKCQPRRQEKLATSMQEWHNLEQPRIKGGRVLHLAFSSVWADQSLCFLSLKITKGMPEHHYIPGLFNSVQVCVKIDCVNNLG